MTISTKNKKIIAIILCLIGGICGIKGAYTIIYAEELVNPLELNFDLFKEYYTIQHIEHKQFVFPLISGITSNGIVNSSITKLDFIYDTKDIPSVRNDITFTFEATLRNPESINHAYVIIDRPHYGDLLVHTKDLENHVKFLKSYNSIYELEKKNFMQYYLKTEPRQYGFEADIALYMLVNNTEHGLEFIPVGDREPILQIHSFNEKLQIDTNRVTLATTEQNQINSKLQQKSNNVIEGISWILLASVLIQPACVIWYSTFSNTRLE